MALETALYSCNFHSNIMNIVNVIATEAFRTITDRLFTEAQIRQVATHTVGKNHIEQASSIISQLQSELGAQTQRLDRVMVEIGAKKRFAMKYPPLAKAGQEQFSAFKSENEKSNKRKV